MSNIFIFLSKHSDVIGAFVAIGSILSGAYAITDKINELDKQLTDFKTRDIIRDETKSKWEESNKDYLNKIPWYKRVFYPPIPVIILIDTSTTQSPHLVQTQNPS